MRQADSEYLYRYWAALKGSRRAPAWRELQPRHLGRLLPDMFSLRAGTSAIGFAGSRLRARLGPRIDDVPFAAFWTEAGVGEIRAALRLMTRSRRPLVLHAAALPDRTGTSTVEILLLPVAQASGGGNSPAAIGILSLDPGVKLAGGRPLLRLHGWQDAEASLADRAEPAAEEPQPRRREAAFSLDVIDGGRHRTS